MTDLEVFKASAEACGYANGEENEGRLWLPDPCFYDGFEWNPFTNAEQRWACVEKLLETEGAITLGQYESWHSKLTGIFTCPASEFPARALAELLWRRSQ